MLQALFKTLRLTLENLQMALEALWGNRLRSLLASLGIVIGVFAVTTMISLGQMAARSIERDIETLIGRGVTIDSNFEVSRSPKPLLERDAERLMQLGFNVVPQVQTQADLDLGRQQRTSLFLYGLPGDLPMLRPTVRLAKGRFYSKTEAKRGAAVLVLSHGAAREIYGNKNPLGKSLRLFFTDGSRSDVVVIGVLSAAGNLAFGTLDAYTPIPFLWNSAPGVKRGEYMNLRIELKRSDDIQRVQKQIEQFINARYPNGVFRVSNTETDAAQANSILGTLQALLAGIAALSLLVGGIGIMNIMLVSVTERTREIGLRKALGATAALIRGQFLIESVVLTLFGGLVGLSLSLFVLWNATLLFSFLGTFFVAAQTVFLALGVSSVIGVIFGVLPAARAARLNAIASLRHE
jgi:putative ABC transport system permease protein